MGITRCYSCGVDINLDTEDVYQIDEKPYSYCQDCHDELCSGCNDEDCIHAKAWERELEYEIMQPDWVWTNEY